MIGVGFPGGHEGKMAMSMTDEAQVKQPEVAISDIESSNPEQLRQEIAELREKIARLEKENADLQKKLSEDEMTDCLKSTYFMPRVAEVLLDDAKKREGKVEYRERGEADGALIFFDLNKFKSINDTYGHDVGDQALKLFSNALKQVRSSDVVSHGGGDEFFIFLKNADEAAIRRVFARISSYLHDHPLRVRGTDTTIDIIFSAGVQFIPSNFVQKLKSEYRARLEKERGELNDQLISQGNTEGDRRKNQTEDLEGKLFDNMIKEQIEVMFAAADQNMYAAKRIAGSQSAIAFARRGEDTLRVIQPNVVLGEDGNKVEFNEIKSDLSKETGAESPTPESELSQEQQDERTAA